MDGCSFALIKGIDEDKLLCANIADFHKKLALENGDVEGLLQSLSHLLFVGAKMYKKQGELDKSKLNIAKALEILEYIDANSANYSFERNDLLAQLKSEQ